MSNIFKLKICTGDANVELEGDGDLVHTMFLELREEGLGMLSNCTSKQPQVTKEDNAEDSFQPSDINLEVNLSNEEKDLQLQPIETIVMKDVANTEAEWILIYALYVSEQGKKLFKDSDIRKAYQDSGRLTESRNKNFATNMKNAVRNDWFLKINDTDYSLSEKGISDAIDIVCGTTKSSAKKKVKKGSSSKPTYKVVELNLNEEQREELKSYMQSFASEKISNMEISLLASYKLSQFGINSFDENVIFTVLRIADMTTSFDINAAINNGKNRKSYFANGEETGEYILHHIGEDHAKKLEKARGSV